MNSFGNLHLIQKNLSFAGAPQSFCSRKSDKINISNAFINLFCMIAYLSCWANYSDSKAFVKRAPVYNGHIFRNKRDNSQTPVENLYKEENLTRTRHCAKSKTLTLTKTLCKDIFVWCTK